MELSGKQRKPSVYGGWLGFAGPTISALGPVPKAFQTFWPPALVQQAPPAILLAALRRFRGPALFRGPRPSSR